MFGPSGPTLSDALRRRFEADRLVFAEVLPQLQHYTWADGSGAFAEGPVDVDIGAGCWESVEILIDFGNTYPSAAPRVYDRRHRWRPDLDRHLMTDHQFCLWLDHVDSPDVSDTSGLREFLLRLLPFLRDQFVFDDLGRWPGPEWRHGAPNAYGQHVIEQLGLANTEEFDRLWPLLLGVTQRGDRACPCGSRLPYSRCHRSQIEALHWVQGLRDRDRLPAAIREQLRDVA